MERSADGVDADSYSASFLAPSFLECSLESESPLATEPSTPIEFAIGEEALFAGANRELRDRLEKRLIRLAGDPVEWRLDSTIAAASYPHSKDSKLFSPPLECSTPASVRSTVGSTAHSTTADDASSGEEVEEDEEPLSYMMLGVVSSMPAPEAAKILKKLRTHERQRLKLQREVRELRALQPSHASQANETLSASDVAQEQQEQQQHHQHQQQQQQHQQQTATSNEQSPSAQDSKSSQPSSKPCDGSTADNTAKAIRQPAWCSVGTVGVAVGVMLTLLVFMFAYAPDFTWANSLQRRSLEMSDSNAVTAKPVIELTTSQDTFDAQEVGLAEDEDVQVVFDGEAEAEQPGTLLKQDEVQTSADAEYDTLDFEVEEIGLREEDGW